MLINSFRINKYGIFTNTEASELSPGINIFFGANGSGKTTCFNFLRSMLGVSPESFLTYANYPGHELLGEIELTDMLPGLTDSSCKIFIKTRQARKIVCNPPEQQKNILNTVSSLSQGDYKNYYAFGLQELEKMSIESDKKAATMLYGASFGPNTQAPGKVLSQLEKHLDELYGESGKKDSIVGLMEQFEHVQQEMGELETALSAHYKKSEELDTRKKILSEIRQKRRELNGARRQLEKRLAAWRQWTEWRTVSEKEKELSNAPDTFPVDAIKRLELILAARNVCEQQLASRKARIESLLKQKDSLECDRSLLDKLPHLRQLAEKKGTVKLAINQLDGLREKSISLTAELKEGFSQLGAEWNSERIQKIDRSLFAREKFEQVAEELTGAREAYQASLASLGTSNKEVASLEEALSTATIALANLPDPESEMSSREREELRSNMGRLQECRKQNKAREKNLENAKYALARALDMARITPLLDNGQIDLDRTRESIEKLLHSRDEGLSISSKIQNHVTQINLLHERLGGLETGADNINKKMDDILARESAVGKAARDSIDSRSRALHSLRANVSRLGNAREKLEQIDQKIRESPEPKKSLKALAFWPGAIITLAGCVLFYFVHFRDLQALSLNDLSIPLNLPICYGLTALGVLLVGLGWPGRNNTRKLHREEMARLLAARESENMQIDDLNEENKKLANTAGITETDPITLDATEMLLEREKEQHIHEEINRQELDKLQEEYQKALKNIEEIKGQIGQQEDEIQRCRKEWQDLLDRMRISDSPSPESAPTIFTRVEACQIALDNVLNAEKELNELWEDLHILESSISSMPAVEARLKNANDPIGLEEAVHLVLESCKNIDKMWQEKVQAKAALKTVENELARAHARQEDTARRLEEANSRLEKARTDWNDQIAEFGISGQADPQTMREALRLMDKCLANEKALETVSRAIHLHESEITDLERSLSGILHELNLRPIMGADGKNDLLATLTQLLEKAEANADISNEQKRLDSLLASQQEDLAATEAELKMIESRETTLISQSSAHDREEFLRLGELFAKKQNLASSRAKLEEELKIAAGDKALDEFLSSFTEDELAVGEEKLDSMQAQIEKLTDEEEKLSNETGLLEATINGFKQPGDISLARQKLAQLAAALDHKRQDWLLCACAIKLLRKAVNEYEISSQPLIAKQASSYFSDMAGQNWKGLRVNLETKSVFLVDANDRPWKPQNVNRSLMELAHLSFHLACIKDNSLNSQPLPILMDDIFANFDEINTERSVKLLINLAGQEKTRQQIIFFTCHQLTRDLFLENDKGAKLFILKDNKIQAA